MALMLFARLTRNFIKSGYFPTDAETLQRIQNALAPAQMPMPSSTQRGHHVPQGPVVPFFKENHHEELHPFRLMPGQWMPDCLCRGSDMGSGGSFHRNTKDGRKARIEIPLYHFWIKACHAFLIDAGELEHQRHKPLDDTSNVRHWRMM